MRLPRIVWPAVAALALAACRTPAPATAPLPPVQPLHFVAEYVVPREPESSALRFGGISGLASLNGGRQLLGIADDRENSRVYRFDVVGEPPQLRIVPTATIRLQAGGSAPAKLDPEGIAVTKSGHILISSEGIGNEEPRLPPAILEYSAAGEFIRQIEVRQRFVPTPQGDVLY
ncbi:MAG: esterase-like activity of phytase family protein, partial [Vicinamibacterales bacterium]